MATQTPTLDVPEAEQPNSWLTFDENEIRTVIEEHEASGNPIPYLNATFDSDAWVMKAHKAHEVLGMPQEQYDGIMEKALNNQELTPEEQKTLLLIQACHHKGVDPKVKETVPSELELAVYLLEEIFSERPPSYANPTEAAMYALALIKLSETENLPKELQENAEKLKILHAMGGAYNGLRYNNSIQEAQEKAVQTGFDLYHPSEEIQQELRGFITNLTGAFDLSGHPTRELDLASIRPEDVPRPEIKIDWNQSTGQAMIMVYRTNPIFEAVYNSVLGKTTAREEFGKTKIFNDRFSTDKGFAPQTDTDVELTPAERLVNERYIARTSYIRDSEITDSELPTSFKSLYLLLNSMGASVDPVEGASSPEEEALFYLATIRSRDSRFPPEVAETWRIIGQTYKEHCETVTPGMENITARIMRDAATKTGIISDKDALGRALKIIEELQAANKKVWDYRLGQEEAQNAPHKAAVAFLEEKEAKLGNPICFYRFKQALEKFDPSLYDNRNYFPFEAPDAHKLLEEGVPIHEACVAAASFPKQPTQEMGKHKLTRSNYLLLRLYESVRDVSTPTVRRKCTDHTIESTSLMHCFSTDLIRVLGELFLPQRVCSTPNFNWNLDEFVSEEKINEIDKYPDKKLKILIDEKFLLFNILTGATRAVGKTNLNVTKKTDRDELRTALESQLADEDTTINPYDLAEKAIPMLFAQADQVFQEAEPDPTPTEEPPAPPAPPNNPPGNGPPGGGPKPPETPETPELKLFPNLGRILDFANTRSAFEKARRGEAKRQKAIKIETRDLLTRCKRSAVRVLDDVAGRTEKIADKRTCKDIKGGYLRRKNPQNILPPNITVKGYLEVEFGKPPNNQFKLKYEMDLQGNLVFETDDGQKHDQTHFFKSKKPTPPTNFYNEVRLIVLRDLIERLERAETENEQRYVKAGSSQVGSLNRRTAKGGSVRCDAAKLIPSVKGSGLHNPQPARVTPLVLAAIAKAEQNDPDDPVTEQMLEHITLYKLEKFTDRSGELRKVYLPLITGEAIEQLANGDMSKDEVYISKHRRGMGRARYHTYTRDKILECTPNKPSDTTEDLQDITEKVLGFPLSRDVENLTTIMVHPDIKKVMIGTRAQINANSPQVKQVTREELDELVTLGHRVMKRGKAELKGTRFAIIPMKEIKKMIIEEESGEKIPDELYELVHQILLCPPEIGDVADETRWSLSNVVFNAEQNAQYNKGIFETLAEEEALLLKKAQAAATENTEE